MAAALDITLGNPDFHQGAIPHHRRYMQYIIDACAGCVIVPGCRRTACPTSEAPGAGKCTAQYIFQDMPSEPWFPSVAGPSPVRCRSSGRSPYTSRNPAAGPDSGSISPLREGGGPAWPSSPARGLIYDLYLQKSGGTCLSFEDSLQRLFIPYHAMFDKLFHQF